MVHTLSFFWGGGGQSSGCYAYTGSPPSEASAPINMICEDIRVWRFGDKWKMIGCVKQHLSEALLQLEQKQGSNVETPRGGECWNTTAPRRDGSVVSR